MSFKMVTYFCQCYLHQDWMVDYADTYEALNDFIKNEALELKTELKDELQYLIAHQNELPNDFFDNLGSYDPKFNGLSTTEWFERLLKILNN